MLLSAPIRTWTSGQGCTRRTKTSSLAVPTRRGHETAEGGSWTSAGPRRPRLAPPDTAGPAGAARIRTRPDPAGPRTPDLAEPRDPAGPRWTPDPAGRRTPLAGSHLSVIGLSGRRVMKGSCSGARCDKPLTRTRVGVGGSQLKSGRGGLAGVARVGRGGRRWPSRRADDKNMRPDIGPDIGPEGVRSQRLTSTFRAGNALAKVA